MGWWSSFRDSVIKPVANVATLGIIPGLSGKPEREAQQAAQNAAQQEAIKSQFALTPEEAAVGTQKFDPLALSRLGTKEEQMQRAKLARDLMVQQQAAQRQLASQQARMGLRGGAATAQQSRLARQLEQARAVQEEEGQLGRTMFNLQQEQREKFANLAAELARQQMLAAKAGQKMQSQAAALGGLQQVQAAQEAAKPTGLLSNIFGGLF